MDMEAVFFPNPIGVHRQWMIELTRQNPLAYDRKAIEAECAKKPMDGEALTDWGGFLVVLSKYGLPNPKEAKEILEEAVSKLEKALEFSPTNHRALYLLGIAHRNMAWQISDYKKAKIKFDEAFQCFLKALQLCPGNKDYLTCLKKVATHYLEMHKAPLLVDILCERSSTVEDTDKNEMERVKKFQLCFCPNLDPKTMDASQLKLYHASRTFVAEYAKDPSALVNCGPFLENVLKALRDGDITETKEKLKDVGSELEMKATRDESVLIALGNNYTAIAFLTPDHRAAKIDLDQALQCFLEAVQMCPANEDYLKALKLSARHYFGLHQKMYEDRVGGGSTACSSAIEDSAKNKNKNKNKNNDSNYEVYGWVALAVGLVAWIAISSSTR